MSEKNIDRLVEWYEYETIPGKIYSDKTLQGKAIFHQWGLDYEESETGIGTYTVAIIELGDGQVKSVPCELIKFIS